ncbi:hypothetical protein BB558_000297 [Smittium angustum]|uniref:Uncharacterized protein n=1 Tax=Smittium angustum TaxID=133377 RepID=A0A2U1JEN4_SMIAN|nr:hypothetical protein BB558_000297 [Smittium angustum]
MINKISSYEILTKIFILSQNPEVRFVSHEFHEISALNSVRVSFLLKKFGKKRVLEISNDSFISFPNLFRKQELVLKLLKKGATPESKSKQDLFRISIKRGWKKVTKHLLNLFTETTKENFQDVVQDRINENGVQRTILQQEGLKYYKPTIDINYGYGKLFELAISNKHTDIVKQLLNAHLIKPKLDCDESKTEILTHPKVYFNFLAPKELCDLFEEEGLELIKLFFNNGFHQNYVYRSTFSEFCKRGSMKFIKFYVENGADILVENDGALKFASFFGHLKVVKYLVENGSDIRSGNDMALREASFYGHLKVVKYLVQNGADIQSGSDFALRRASGNGRLEIVKYLIENGADIHADNDCALRKASLNGHLKVVKYLVKSGADIHANSDCALRWASERGHKKIVKYLKKEGNFSKKIQIIKNFFRYVGLN